MSDGKSDTGVKSARRVLGILELLTSKAEPLALHTIASTLELPRSSAHSLMGTLVATGFVRQQPDKRYALSTKWLALVSAALGAAERTDFATLRHTTYPVMLRTSRNLEMTCNLAVLNKGHVVYVDKIDSGGPGLQIGTHVGAMLPAHATALGKSIVSSMADDERELWLQEHCDYSALTPRTSTSIAALRQELERSRDAGYAVDDEESHLGLICVGSAILNVDGEPVAAISVSGVKPAVEAHGVEATGIEIREAAQEVSASLGAGSKNRAALA